MDKVFFNHLHGDHMSDRVHTYCFEPASDRKSTLDVWAHFPVADDTVGSAFDSVKAHCPDIEMGRDIVWSFNRMVLRVFPDRIEQVRVNGY